MEATTGERGERKGNSLGRAALGRSEMEATTGWTEGKAWEIAWGELRWERARRKRRQGGNDTEATTRWTEGKKAWGELGELRCEGARWKQRQGGGRGKGGK